MKIAPELDSMILFVLLILPGLISMHVYRLFMPAKSIDWKDALIEAFFYGTLNFGICLFIIIPLHQNHFYENHMFWYYILMVLVLIILPVIWPILLYKLFNWSWLKNKIQLPYCSAWDYFFIKRKPCFVLIHLKKGNMIGGIYYKDSYATSFPHDGDLYLEKVYKVDEQGVFLEEIEKSAGMLIQRDAYEYIEFFND